MNDIWNFILSLGDGLQGALATVDLLMVLLVGLIIGLFQPKGDKLALKAALAVLVVFAIRLLLPSLSGHRIEMPDFRHLGAIVQLLLMYFFAYGVIGVLGALKAGMKMEAKKA
jgi:hypothetical protein